MIDVVDESVQRPHALLESCGEMAPFVGRNDARNDVERDQPLGSGLLAIHGERDAHAME